MEDDAWGQLAIAASRAEAARLVRLAAGPHRPDETVKARMRRTAHMLGWKFSRVRAIWQHTALRIDAHEMDQLRALETIPPEISDSG